MDYVTVYIVQAHHLINHRAVTYCEYFFGNFPHHDIILTVMYTYVLNVFTEAKLNNAAS